MNINPSICSKIMVNIKTSKYQKEKIFLLFINNYFFASNTNLFLINLKTKFDNFFKVYRNICNILDY